MSQKNKNYGQAIGFYFSLPFIYFVSVLPFPLLYFISDVLAFVLYSLVKYRRGVVSTNLKNSFPEKSIKELGIIEKEYYTVLSDYILESVKSLTISKEEIMKHGGIKNPEVFHYYKEKKQNIILSMGHVGSQEIINMYGSVSPHFPRAKVVYRPLNNPYFERLFKKSRERFGSKLVPMDDAYKSAARQDEMCPFALMLLNDQSATPEKAYWTTFLNQETCFFAGTELLAKRFNMPVVYAHFTRPKRGVFEAEIIVITDNPRETPPHFITETHARLLEKNIIENPPIWLWSHKRWKHKRII